MYIHTTLRVYKNYNARICTSKKHSTLGTDDVAGEIEGLQLRQLDDEAREHYCAGEPQSVRRGWYWDPHQVIVMAFYLVVRVCKVWRRKVD